MATENSADVLPGFVNKRRAVRYKLDVPLRVVLQRSAATLIREGRGTELSEHGMCLWTAAELKIGEDFEVEFTIPFSGEPIRVASVVRNRKAFNYGCEFTPTGPKEQENVARLSKVLKTFAGAECS
jgi:hypothetical protein